jgi:hypothetical protein
MASKKYKAKLTKKEVKERQKRARVDYNKIKPLMDEVKSLMIKIVKLNEKKK